ncbi:hypothetical protein ACJO5Y_15005 [Marinobacter sp. GN3S48]|uniref:hypothetical protein n=1 Tax=Marinobacter sp. GN3S48 TaxID=3382302 RepID=UPI00387B347A
MSQNEQFTKQYDDEISLVDLATIFVRRRRIFFAVCGGVVLLALAYALFLVGEVKEYTTLVQLGEQIEDGEREPLEPAATVVATIENRWYPEQQALYIELENSRMPFQVSAEAPRNTSLIKLTSKASPVKAEAVTSIHEKLVDHIVRRQTQLLERKKQTLEQRLKYVNEYLEGLSGQESMGEAAAQAVQERIEISGQIESLQPAETLVVARESLDNKGTSKRLIMVLAVFLGLMLGIVATFMAEFIGKVRQELAESPVK